MNAFFQVFGAQRSYKKGECSLTNPALTWAEGSLARIYQGVANGLLVFGKKSLYGD